MSGRNQHVFGTQVAVNHPLVVGIHDGLTQVFNQLNGRGQRNISGVLIHVLAQSNGALTPLRDNITALFLRNELFDFYNVFVLKFLCHLGPPHHCVARQLIGVIR